MLDRQEARALDRRRVELSALIVKTRELLVYLEGELNQVFIQMGNQPELPFEEKNTHVFGVDPVGECKVGSVAPEIKVTSGLKGVIVAVPEEPRGQTEDGEDILAPIVGGGIDPWTGMPGDGFPR